MISMLHAIVPERPTLPSSPAAPDARGFLVGLRCSRPRASFSMRAWSSSLAVSPRRSGAIAASSCAWGEPGRAVQGESDLPFRANACTVPRCQIDEASTGRHRSRTSSLAAAVLELDMPTFCSRPPRNACGLAALLLAVRPAALPPPSSCWLACVGPRIATELSCISCKLCASRLPWACQMSRRGRESVVNCWWMQVHCLPRWPS